MRSGASGGCCFASAAAAPTHALALLSPPPHESVHYTAAHTGSWSIAAHVAVNSTWVGAGAGYLSIAALMIGGQLIKLTKLIVSWESWGVCKTKMGRSTGRSPSDYTELHSRTCKRTNSRLKPPPGSLNWHRCFHEYARYMQCASQRST